MQTVGLQLNEILTLNDMKIEASFQVEQMLYYDLTKYYVLTDTELHISLYFFNDIHLVQFSNIDKQNHTILHHGIP